MAIWWCLCIFLKKQIMFGFNFFGTAAPESQDRLILTSLPIILCLANVKSYCTVKNGKKKKT